MCTGVPDTDDSSDLFSVRSEPFVRRGSNQKQRSQIQANGSIPQQVTSKSRIVTPSPIQAPRRTNSLPSPNRPIPEVDTCDLESVTSEVSQRSRQSIASAPASFSGRRLNSYPTSQSAYTPSHPQLHHPYDRSCLPPKHPGKNASKEKKSVFAKMFSNQVQADFDEGLLAEQALRDQTVTSSRQPVPVDYGVEPSGGDSRRSVLLKGKSDSLRSFCESSLRSAVSQSTRASSRNGTKDVNADLDDPDHADCLAESHDSQKNEKGGKSFGKLFRRKAKDVDKHAA